MSKQAAQVLELLEFFAERKRAATLADVTEHFGWPRSSAFNLLTMLAGRGYLYEPRPKGGYYPSPRWFSLAEQIRMAEPTPLELHETLHELVRMSGETVSLVAASGGIAVFVDVIESPHDVRYAAKIGKTVSLYSSATGRALLSLRSEAERERLLRKAVFVQYTDNTLMSADAVEREIRRSIRRGWFIGHCEISVGLCGVALPVPMADRHYAILVAGPADRMSNRYDELGTQARAIIADYLQIEVPGGPLATVPA